MKILFVAGTLGKGGAERQLFYLCQILKTHTFNVKVACLTHGEYFEHEIDKLGIEVIYVGKSKNKFIRIYEVYRLVKKNRPDLIYGFHFYTGFYAGFVGKITNTLSFGSIRNDGYSEKKSNGLFSWLHYALPTQIIANSLHGLENSRKIFYSKKISLLPNIIDLDIYKYEPKKRENVLHLLFIGSLKNVKQPHLFIELIHELVSNGVAVHGKIIGKGILEKKLKIQAKGLPVQFLGNIDDVRPYIKEADYLISTSLHEGTPNVILEAFATGTPVLALYHEGLNDWVKNNYLLKISTIEEMQKIIMDKKVSCNTENNRIMVEKEHSNQKVFEIFSSFFNP